MECGGLSRIRRVRTNQRAVDWAAINRRPVETITSKNVPS
ncbi:MAG: hypothetical protein JWM53_4970, partial [bacterium]|nr:hypothetical protein [bacterium]